MKPFATAESVRYYSRGARLVLDERGEVVDQQGDDVESVEAELNRLAQEYMARNPSCRSYNEAFHKMRLNNPKVGELLRKYAVTKHDSPKPTDVEVRQFTHQTSPGEQAANLLDVAAKRVMERDNLKDYATAVRVAMRENPAAAQAYAKGR